MKFLKIFDLIANKFNQNIISLLYFIFLFKNLIAIGKVRTNTVLNEIGKLVKKFRKKTTR